jgi:outer membrane protein OmpA-like peptidoglycan-associated protein
MMKMKFLLSLILLGAITLSSNAQDFNPCDCDEAATLVKLDNGEEAYLVKQGSYQFAISKSNMAKYRKTYNCPDILAQPAPEAESPAPIQGPYFLPDPVFFRINKWVIDPQEWHKVELAVNYLNTHPGSTVVVSGYADRKTGNPFINEFLSKQRSNAVAEAMEIKYGIDSNRISVNWEGDVVQPFQFENDKNRAVLFLVKP